MIPFARLALAAALSEAPSPATPAEAFAAGASLYEERRYAEAAAELEALLARGIDHGAVHYNLANAYFRDGKLGRAILHYERALRRLPGDEDARENLDYARERIQDAADPPPLPPFVAWTVRLYERLGPSFWAFVLSSCFLFGGAAVSLLISQRWPRARTASLYTLSIAAVVALLAAAALAAKLHLQAATVEAVVLSPRAELRSGPAPSYPTLAEVREGWKVSVLGAGDEWVQVSSRGGLTGWIRRDHVETIGIAEAPVESVTGIGAPPD